MICYKNKTFCPFKECKNFFRCPDALTQKVRAAAISAELLISKHIKKPLCFISIEESIK